MTDQTKKYIKHIAAYFAASSLLLGAILMLYLPGTSIIGQMNAAGWLFYITSCLSHAAVAMLPAAIIAALLGRGPRRRRAGTILMVVWATVLAILAVLNMQVFQLYRFHINGMVLSLVFGGGAAEIFNFSPWLYVKEALLLLFVACLPVALLFLVRKWRRGYGWVIIALLLCGVLANGMHIYGAFTQHTAILKARQAVPYYFPLSATSLMRKMGFTPPVASDLPPNTEEADVNYPIHPLRRADKPQGNQPNIVLIMIDSWSKRSLTADCMPNTYALAQQSQWYGNHVSCSNGTRFGVFGLFFSVPAYYWSSFEAHHLSPLLLDELMAQGYDLRVHASATLESPPFARVVFHKVPNLQTNTSGNTPLERDTHITTDFLGELPALKRSGKPFFSFLFYDLPHSFELPEDSLARFQPAWPYADYAELSNDTDPTPFFNLYRNCCYQTDRLVGQVLRALEAEGLKDETIVIITGDHAQEFNENHQNYWGHNGNFSQWQIGVPLIVSWPGKEAAHLKHRTTHYDIVPTLMHDALGISNPTADYSQGLLLSDTTPRDCHLVGHELRYAFILGGDTIATKHGDGLFEVTDSRLNPVNNYKLTPATFNKMVETLNHFYK